MRFRLVFNFLSSRLTTLPNQLSIIKTYFLGHYLSTKVKSHEGSRGARKNLLHTTADNMRKWAFGLQGRRLGWFLTCDHAHAALQHAQWTEISQKLRFLQISRRDGLAREVTGRGSLRILGMLLTARREVPVATAGCYFRVCQ